MLLILPGNTQLHFAKQVLSTYLQMNISSEDEMSKINEEKKLKALRTLSGRMNVSVLTVTLLLLLKCPISTLCLYACPRELPKRPNAHGRRQPTPYLSIT